MQDRLKRALEAAKVLYRVYSRDAKESIAWSRQHDEAVQKIEKEKVLGAIPAGRNVSFDNPAEQQRFIDWLTEQKIGHEVIVWHGRAIVVWAETSGDALERFTQHRMADCRRKEVD